MLSPFQPVKRASKTSNDSPGINNASSTGKQKATARKAAGASTVRSPKRRKLNTDQKSSTRPKTASLLARQGTIESYFTPSDSNQSDEPQKPPVSLYDDIQHLVHEAEAKSEDKRTLRSHDEGSSRLKSALAIYFPNYDDVINDAPKTPELLNADTVIVIKRDKEDGGKKAVSPTKAQRRKSELLPAAEIGKPNKYNGAQILDFSVIEKNMELQDDDPLDDAAYFKAHRRAERKEKQLRNIERERAMHEKAQLEQLLDGLLGHDWLRVMGVTGVTDSEAQKYQSKREYFIQEVKALVKKFQEWREEEKRQKLERTDWQLKSQQAAERELSQDERDSREPTASEIDASASRQLQQEISGSAKAKTKRKVINHVHPIIYRAPSPEGPFTSFFDKPHIRDAALGKSRHGRSALAFGHAIPEPDEEEFELPSEYTDPQSLKESARRRRRMKRETAADSGSKR